jgi:hypothetical protein
MKSSLSRLEGITSDLIPYLQTRTKSGSSYDDLLEMNAAFKRAGEQLGDFVKTLPVGDLSEDAVSILFEQLAQTLDLKLIDGLDRKLFLAKWMMFNTRKDAIERTDWPQFFRSALTLSGLALSLKTSTTTKNFQNQSTMDRVLNDYQYREFVWKLVLETKPLIIESLTQHNGNTPFPIFDRLMDEIPDDILNGIPKREIKDMIRPLVRKLLMSKSQTGVDANVVNTIFTLLENIVQDLGMIDRFYESTGLDTLEVQDSVYKISLNQYENSLNGPEKTRFTELKNTILTYKPMFFRDSNSMMFQNGIGYSRIQSVIVVTLNRFLNHLHRTYGSGDGFFTEDDFRGILD